MVKSSGFSKEKREMLLPILGGWSLQPLLCIRQIEKEGEQNDHKGKED